MKKIHETHIANPLLKGEIRLLGGLGERLFKLLAAIQTSGSINKAAKEVGLTYKGAWEMIERANNLSPKLLVSTAVGGHVGGGTRLTPTGKAILELFLHIQEEHMQFLEQINQRLASNQDVLFLLKRLFVRASARNQFFGKVTHVVMDSVCATVVMHLKGGQPLVATVSREAIEQLNIKIGGEVIALIKAPQITLITDCENYRFSARNQLQGNVTRIQKGGVNSEVSIELSGGDTLTSTITNESLESLHLSIGATATALFKAGAVVLGVSSE
ncbi:MAG: TOBE domain-containing protein [Methylovulum sp.]|nr:TOBE domain-containing protein [Methylovulum sp.]MCF7998092.1 TOBE domain-containing protein [Methylovulum sp.]